MKKQFYNTKEKRIIYVLVSPFEKIIFVNQSLEKTLKESYRHHIKCRRYSSKKFIEKISPARPCLFKLEKIYGTKADAYKLMLIWMKIFSENGYEIYNDECSKELSQNLYYNNQQLYLKRKKIRIGEKLICENCVLPAYKNEKCPYRKTKSKENGEQKSCQEEKKKSE